jgi:hypothetical protein
MARTVWWNVRAVNHGAAQLYGNAPSFQQGGNRERTIIRDGRPAVREFFFQFRLTCKDDLYQFAVSVFQIE